MTNTITLAKFLAIFYGFTGDGLKTLKHDDIKVHFPNIKICEEKEVDKLARRGDVVYVWDGKKILPYYTNTLENEYYTVNIKKEEKKKKKPLTKDITEMNNYELLQLLNIRFNTISKSRQARKELTNRGRLNQRVYKLKREQEYLNSRIKEGDL